MDTRYSAISRIESRRRPARQKTLARLAQALEMHYVHSFEIEDSGSEPVKGSASGEALSRYPASPCERASSAAAVRLATPSLRKTFRMWFLTERSVMNSRSAI